MYRCKIRRLQRDGDLQPLFGHVLEVVSALLLRCSFAVTGEAITTVKLSKPMLGDQYKQKEICGALCVVWGKFTTSPVISYRLNCDFVLARSWKKLCSSSLFDFRMTIKCTACSWYHGSHSISRCHHVLYLMHMCLINDTIYQEGKCT